MRVVHKLKDGPEQEISKALEKEKKRNWDKQFKEDYNLSQLRRAMEIKRRGKTIDWFNTERGRHPGMTTSTAKVRWVTVIKEGRWITLKCRKKEVLLATDWNIATCYEEAPVWLDPEGERSKMKFLMICLLYTSPSPRDGLLSRMPSSA